MSICDEINKFAGVVIYETVPTPDGRKTIDFEFVKRLIAMGIHPDAIWCHFRSRRVYGLSPSSLLYYVLTNFVKI